MLMRPDTPLTVHSPPAMHGPPLRTQLLNRHQSSSCQSLFAEIQSTLTPSHISSLSFSENQVATTISQLKLFKTGSSTTLCTGVIKNVISRYTHRGSSVLGCFLDASKAFDLVDHQILFRILLEHDLRSNATAQGHRGSLLHVGSWNRHLTSI